MKPKRELSELQKANLLTGQLLRRCSCTSELIKLLRECGQHSVANDVERGFRIGRELAADKGRVAIRNALFEKVKKDADQD